MTVEHLFELAWKSALCAGLVLAALRLIRRRSAAERALLARFGLVGILLLPVATFVLPALPVAAPAAVAEAYDRVAAPRAPSIDVADEPETPARAEPAAAPFGWRDLILLGWAIPAGFLLLLTLAGIARLHRLRGRADILTDATWLTALASAQRRFGLRHGTALLVSSELRSPISWGVVRPVIVIDPRAAQDPARAEAIIVHELAHVARLDWLGLLLGRAAAALFWFNPLVWMLMHRAHDLSEQAADDVVLRGNVPGADYAEVLVGAARHATPPLLLAANGVAPGRGSLGRRILAVLDPSKSRVPVGIAWSLLTFGATGGVAGAVAAVDPCLAVASAAVADTDVRGDYAARVSARLAAIATPQTRALARAIGERDWKLRRSRGETLFDEPAAAEPLMLALRDEDATVRRIAAWGLSELRPPQAAAPLVRLLDDEAPEVRGEAARALGDIGGAGVTLAVAGLLRDPDPVVRRQAAHSLADLRDPAARPALEAALGDSDPMIQGKVRWALEQIAEAEKARRRGGGT